MKNVKNMIVASVLCVGLAISLCACSTSQYAPNNTTHAAQSELVVTSGGLEIVGKYTIDDDFDIYYFTYFRDTKSDVMYMMCHGPKVGAYDSITGLTVMMDDDGTPTLYSEWVKTND